MSGSESERSAGSRAGEDAKTELEKLKGWLEDREDVVVLTSEKVIDEIKKRAEGESSSSPTTSERSLTPSEDGGGKPPKPYGVVTDKIKCDCGVIPLLLDTGDMKCHGCGKIYDFKIKLEEKEK